MCAAISRPRSASTSPITTLAPSATSSSAVARPIPPAPPVTTATFPSSSCVCMPRHYGLVANGAGEAWRGTAPTETSPDREERTMTSKNGSAALSVPHPVVVPDQIPKERYYDPAFYASEAQQLLPRVWQMACRLEEIPGVGDFVEYEILDQSVILVR